ncbi:hypothetical protein ACHAW5_008924 [Stephanodiscus triporus]|uniref:Uncharacterized protein n=1 Tax=Stephanodiscus triporus TaxID=2934178 RepID=A0ABD3MLE5_9STRA
MGESRVVVAATPLDAIFASAIGRCSLVRAAYEIVAVGRSYEELAERASKNGSFADLIGNDAPTWSIRLRRYGVLRDRHRDDASNDDDASRRDEDGHRRQRRGHLMRFGKNARSPLREERNAILSMAGLVRVLDPFAGSCATLLAASHIASGLGGCLRSVAIEIAHGGHVSRDDIVRDFESRSLPPPTEIIHGDCLSAEIRRRARAAIGGEAFDVICTDPPYGIREAITGGDGGEGGNIVPPLTLLFHAMGHDRLNEGTPLLKVGGRLVAFVPVRKDERLEDCLPDHKAREDAGLVMEGEGKEQVLSDSLSRFLVSFVCVS